MPSLLEKRPYQIKCNLMDKESLQENEYEFPYHHLVNIRPFSESRHLFWGYRYAAYVEHILQTLAQKQFESLIDFGCGDGKITTEIQRAFPDSRIVGVDYSEKSLSFGRAFSPDIEFATASDEQFDAFVLIEVLEHIDPSKMSDFLDTLSRNLKTGAFGIVTTPSTVIPTNIKHYQHFTEETFRKTLGSHFEVEHIEFVGTVTSGTRFIQRLLANKFFILNHAALIERLYRIYETRYFKGTPRTGAQVFAVVRKK